MEAISIKLVQKETSFFTPAELHQVFFKRFMHRLASTETWLHQEKTYIFLRNGSQLGLRKTTWD